MKIAMQDIFFVIDILYPEELNQFHNYFPFFPKRMKKLRNLANLHDKKEYLIKITNFKN